MIPRVESIALRGVKPPTHVPVDRVYFAFASGRLAYDCVACNAKCCRGYGYEVEVGAPLQAHLATRPAVRFFLDPADGDWQGSYRVRNCPPSCFFLTEGNLCGIQAEHGYDSKPETCRLFPFNYFRRVGDYLIVAPHDGLCPLQILPGGEYDEKSNYEQLLATMRAHGISAEIPQVESLNLGVATHLSVERAIVGLSEQYLESGDYVPFVVAQICAERDSVDTADRATSREPAEEMVDRFRHRLTQVLGASPAAANRGDLVLVRTLVATTPFLRSELVFPRKANALQPATAESAQVPFILLALHSIAAFAREAGMREITYQVITRLFADHRALLTMLGYLDRPVVWKPGEMIDVSVKGRTDFHSRYLAIARALVPRKARYLERPLGQILVETIDYDGLDRVAFLKYLAGRLIGRIISADAGVGTRNVRWRFRPALQRWAFDNLSPETLTSIAAGRPKPGST